MASGRKKGCYSPNESLIQVSEKQEDVTVKPTVVNNNMSEDPELLIKKPYKCCMCGTRFTKQDGHFPYSQSPFFKGNNSYLPLCNSCLNSSTDQYQTILKDQDEAIKRMCLRWDIYYSEKILNSTKKIDAKRSRIKEYIRQCNLTQNAGKTYDNYLSESHNCITEEDFNYETDEMDGKAKQKNIAKWGSSYSDAEFLMLNEHYKMYRDRIDENDPTQVTLLRNLCEQYILQARCLKDKDIDKYDKVSKLYQQTLGNANLKPKSQDTNMNNPDECWGNFGQIVEKFSPAEYYKDKKIFKDYDEQDEYYRRFIERPTNNLINGTTEMDDEYSIKVTDDE